MAQVNLPISERIRREAPARSKRQPAEFALVNIDVEEIKGAAVSVSKGAIVVAAIAIFALVMAKPLYTIKSELGIDLIPGIHAPDVFESLQ